MNHNILYTACFLDYDELWAKIGHITNGRYERVIRDPHITFCFKPDEVDLSLVGTKVKVLITGYGYNGMNEGLGARLITDNEKLNALYKKIEVPHITLTVDKRGRAVNTRYVDFEPIPVIEISAVFGIVDMDNRLITDPAEI